MHPNLLPSLICGLFSAGLLLLILASGLGFFFLFLPCLPLLVYGMGKHAQIALWGSGIATVLVALAAGLASAILFFFCLGLPAWYIARLAMVTHESSLAMPGGKDLKLVAWFPIGEMFLRLTLYACALVSLFGLFYINYPGGLEAMIGEHIRANFTQAEGEMRDAVELLAGRWSFLIFSSTIWLWALALYAHLWAANVILEKKQWPHRPDIIILPFMIPAWMLQLMAIGALASLIGGPTVAFLGKTALIALMLPYFLHGIGLMHLTSLAWPNRRIFLFFIYFFIATQFWPALILSGLGLYHQIKRLYLLPTSTKS